MITITFVQYFCYTSRCPINNSFICTYPIINEENTALLLYIRYRATSPSEETIFYPPSSWKKRERERRRVRLFFTLSRATIGLSIPGLGSNFSSLRRIITESFPRQAASSANQRLALPLLPPWRARRATDTRVQLCGTSMKNVVWRICRRD